MSSRSVARMTNGQKTALLVYYPVRDVTQDKACVWASGRISLPRAPSNTTFRAHLKRVDNFQRRTRLPWQKTTLAVSSAQLEEDLVR